MPCAYRSPLNVWANFGDRGEVANQPPRDLGAFIAGPQPAFEPLLAIAADKPF